MLYEVITGFTDMYGNAYTGDVQVIMTNNSRSTPINTFQSLIEFSKNLKNHQLRIGLKETFYNPGEYAFNRSFFYQEVGANPRQLTNYGSSSSNFATTDQYGFFVITSYSIHYTKLYDFSDLINIVPSFQ